MADKHLTHWATRRLSAIRKAEVHALHLRLADEAGKYLSNRVCELLRAMYNYAKENLGYTGENPTAGVKRFPEEKRTAFCTRTSWGRFLRRYNRRPRSSNISFCCCCDRPPDARTCKQCAGMRSTWP